MPTPIFAPFPAAEAGPVEINACVSLLSLLGLKLILFSDSCSHLALCCLFLLILPFFFFFLINYFNLQLHLCLEWADLQPCEPFPAQGSNIETEISTVQNAGVPRVPELLFFILYLSYILYIWHSNAKGSQLHYRGVLKGFC